jgi:hypothetical protein
LKRDNAETQRTLRSAEKNAPRGLTFEVPNASMSRRGYVPPITWKTLKTKGLQNGFLKMHEKKGAIFPGMGDEVSSKMGMG